MGDGAWKTMAYLLGHDGAKAHALAQALGVSTRTVRSYVRHANELFAPVAHISSPHHQGYRVQVHDQVAFSRLVARYQAQQDGTCPGSPHDRRRLIAMRLASVDDWATVTGLAHAMCVSTKTISSDLHAVKSILRSHRLSLDRSDGNVHAVGSEFDRRLCLAALAEEAPEGMLDDDPLRRVCCAMGSSLSPIRPDGDATSFTTDTLIKLISTELANDGIMASALSLRALAVHVGIAVLRVRAGHAIPPMLSFPEKSSAMKEYACAGHIAAAVGERYGVRLGEDEVAYLTIHLASKETVRAHAAQDEQGGSLVISDAVWGMVARMLEVVWHNYAIDLRQDIELRMNLARHVAPLIVRLRHHMSAANPLIVDIKDRFPLAYLMALDASSVLGEQVAHALTDEEVGYLALAFALALERREIGRPRKNILLVSASGATSTSLLEQQCRSAFSPYLGEVTSCDLMRLDEVDLSNIDYVFTTAPIGRKLPVPVCHVGVALTQDVVARVRADLESAGGGRDAPCISTLPILDDGLFLPHLEARGKPEALGTLCALLRHHEGLDESFDSLVERREEVARTTFGSGIAFPHPIAPMGSRTVVCVGLLDEPIDWGGEEVRAIFLVSPASAPPNPGDDAARRALVHLISDRQAMDELLRHRDYETLARLFAEHVE